MNHQKVPGIHNGTSISKASLYKNDAFQVLHLHIPAGKELKKHVSDKDACIIVLEGEAEFTLMNELKQIGKNDCIGFEAGQPHSIKAVTDFSMLLLK